MSEIKDKAAENSCLHGMDNRLDAALGDYCAICSYEALRLKRDAFLSIGGAFDNDDPISEDELLGIGLPDPTEPTE